MPALGACASPVARVFAGVVVLAVAAVLPLGGGESGSAPGPTRHRPSAILDASGGFDENTNFPDDVVTPGFPLFLRRVAGAPVEKVWPPPADGARELLLTFDDGPNLETTPLVLSELDRRGVKAIFFIAGHTLVGDHEADRARRYLLRKLARHGHMVANHTINHGDLCAQRNTIDVEIDGNAEILTAATGLRPLLFRSPYGTRCQALHTALTDRGLLNVGWNVDPQEWRATDAHTIANAVIGQIERLPTGRGTILLHDTKHATVRALPMILDWIDGQNRLAASGRTRPIRMLDYSVFLPGAPPLPATGVEPALDRLASDVMGPVADLFGAPWAGAQTGH